MMMLKEIILIFQGVEPRNAIHINALSADKNAMQAHNTTQYNYIRQIQSLQQ